MKLHPVPGLVPGTHVLKAAEIKDVGGRDKPGHREIEIKVDIIRRMWPA